jgi:hypothetical protein
MSQKSSSPRDSEPSRPAQAFALACRLFWRPASLVATLAPLAAGTGDKKGWSVVTDPRKRAFLIWTPAANGPRVLTFGCLRDVDSFTVLSEDTIGRSTGVATLTVSNGTARFEVAGDVASERAVLFVAEHHRSGNSARSTARPSSVRA